MTDESAHEDSRERDRGDVVEGTEDGASSAEESTSSRNTAEVDDPESTAVHSDADSDSTETPDGENGRGSAISHHVDGDFHAREKLERDNEGDPALIKSYTVTNAVEDAPPENDLKDDGGGEGASTDINKHAQSRGHAEEEDKEPASSSSDKDDSSVAQSSVKDSSDPNHEPHDSGLDDLVSQAPDATQDAEKLHDVEATAPSDADSAHENDGLARHPSTDPIAKDDSTPDAKTRRSSDPNAISSQPTDPPSPDSDPIDARPPSSPETNLTNDSLDPAPSTAPPDTDDDDDGPREQLLVDYASKLAGAQILEKSPSLKGTSNLLTGDIDKYAIAPCGDKKYVVIGLSEDILVKQIKLANYERYSSHVREFQVLASQEYPIKGPEYWNDLGMYEAKSKSGEQTFELKEPAWARYLKIRFLSHYGKEHYCTISQIKVHGSTMLQGFHEQWIESEKMERRELEEQSREDDEEEAGEERIKGEQVQEMTDNHQEGTNDDGTSLDDKNALAEKTEGEELSSASATAESGSGESSVANATGDASIANANVSDNESQNEKIYEDGATSSDSEDMVDANTLDEPSTKPSESSEKTAVGTVGATAFDEDVDSSRRDGLSEKPSSNEGRNINLTHVDSTQDSLLQINDGQVDLNESHVNDGSFPHDESKSEESEANVR